MSGMKPLLVLLFGVFFWTACDTHKSQSKTTYFNEKVRCNELADKWALEMHSTDANTKFTLMLVDYSPSKQSCVVCYNYDNPTLTMYFVQDILTNVMYSDDVCSKPNNNCSAEIKKTREVFDNLVKLPN